MSDSVIAPGIWNVALGGAVAALSFAFGYGRRDGKSSAIAKEASEAKEFAAKADAKADKALEKIEAHKLYAANEFARKDEINPTLRRIEDKIDSLREHRRPATAAD